MIPVEIELRQTNESLELQETSSFLVEVKLAGLDDVRLSRKSVCIVQLVPENTQE